MRTRLIWLCALIVTVSSVYAAQDRILARVNNDIITLSDLEERLEPVIAKYESTYRGEELLKQLAKAEEYWLNQLIENKLILQEAARQKIEVTPEEIEDRYLEIKSDFDSDLQFRLFLQSQGMNEAQLKQQIEENIKIGKATMHIREQARTRISPTDVLNYYENHQDEFRDEPMVNPLHILIRISGNEQEAKAKAESIRERIANGEEFSDLAREYSDGPYASKGGDLGFCKYGEHIPEIDDVIFALDVGQTSEVIKTDLGYHIIKVKQKKKERVKPFAEVQDQIEDLILRKKAAQLWDEWIAKLKTRSFVEVYKNE